MVEKIGPYRVYERLGVGGMGEVFKAYDDRLDRWVAIKRIRPDREDAEDNRERFKREARATARLNHPAIVHLYGIFQEGDSDCIVMEYVEGRTLDSILAEGPLDPLRVASLGHEIASGLAEAHANGILHRDLKAENIIITPRGRSKILDFGLAKPILRSELDPVLTGKGQLVGTSRAMSPEYVSGDNVDHRSDLFALGVLLYETLTGQSPFKAHNTLATLKQVMLHRQTPVKQLVPKVPQELSDLIDRLLEKDPTDRPQSAHEVALAFGRLTGQISSGAVEQPSSGTQPIFKPTTSTGAAFSASDTVLDLRPRSRWMTVVVVLVVLLITAFFLGRYLSGPDTSPASQAGVQPVKVLLGDFQNSTGQEMFDVTIAELFRATLQQSESLILLSNVQIREALGRMERPLDSKIDLALGAELAQREGAKFLIVGSISRVGSKYPISAQVIWPENQVVRLSRNATADDDDGIIAAIQKVGNEVRIGLGETAAEIERTSQPLEKVTTPNFEALRAYTIGFQKYIQSDQREEAIAFLQQALVLDPTFAMAHAKLVSIYSVEGNRTKALEHIEAAEKHSDRLSDVERFYIQGWTFRWRGTPRDVIQNWSKMSDLHPKEYAGHHNLGFALWYYQNDLSGAAVAFEKALSIADPSRRPTIAGFLGYCLLGSGKSAEAKPFFELAATVDKWPLIDYYLAIGSRADAKALTLTATPSPDRMALLFLDRGDLTKSETELYSMDSRGRAGNGYPSVWFADLGAVLFLEGKDAEFEKLADRAMTEAQPYLETVGLATDRSPMTTLTTLGKLLARIGRTEKAKAFAAVTAKMSREVALPLWAGHQKMLEAELLMASARPQEALALLDDALSTVDLLTIHESRATCYEQLGRKDDAIREWRQIASGRERSFVEGYVSASGRFFAVGASTLAEREIGRIAQEAGDARLAEEQYSRFAELWPSYTVNPSNRKRMP
jgi:serine/threonine protein kinase/Tfp pilus assembly protein PilF